MTCIQKQRRLLFEKKRLALCVCLCLVAACLMAKTVAADAANPCCMPGRSLECLHLHKTDSQNEYANAGAVPAWPACVCLTLENADGHDICVITWATPVDIKVRMNN